MLSRVENILVMRGGALGDFILTLPVLAALRGRFPKARLNILGYPRVAALAQAGGCADAVAPLEAPRLARMFAADAPMMEEFAGYDLLVSYIYDPEGIWRANIQRSAPNAFYVTGPHRPDDAGALHATEALLAPLAAIGIHEANPVPRLNLGPAVASLGLALHPGSGSERKNWPETHWADLLRLIMERTRWHCLLIGGEAEVGKLERLQNAARSASGFAEERLEVAQNLDLVELGRRLQRRDFFVGHDSGVTHLAAALGRRGLVLWGESNMAVWRPRGDRMEIMRAAGGLSRLPVADVFGKLTAASIV
jgi:ADP-heptose:LPS heptosyltransferase